MSADAQFIDDLETAESNAKAVRSKIEAGITNIPEPEETVPQIIAEDLEKLENGFRRMGFDIKDDVQNQQIFSQAFADIAASRELRGLERRLEALREAGEKYEAARNASGVAILVHDLSKDNYFIDDIGNYLETDGSNLRTCALAIQTAYGNLIDYVKGTFHLDYVVVPKYTPEIFGEDEDNFACIRYNATTERTTLYIQEEANGEVDQIIHEVIAWYYMSDNLQKANDFLKENADAPEKRLAILDKFRNNIPVPRHYAVESILKFITRIR